MKYNESPFLRARYNILTTEDTWMKRVEVYKTSVQEAKEAVQIIALLLDHFPGCKVNFDLDDCDCILRIETHNGMMPDMQIKRLLSDCGHCCELLTD